MYFLSNLATRRWHMGAVLPSCAVRLCDLNRPERHAPASVRMGPYMDIHASSRVLFKDAD
jgi:hypothetical protein